MALGASFDSLGPVSHDGRASSGFSCQQRVWDPIRFGTVVSRQSAEPQSLGQIGFVRPLSVAAREFFKIMK